MPKQSPRSRGAVALITGLCLAILTFLLYSPSLRSGFVYDAEVQIKAQPFIHQHEHLLDVLTFRVMSWDVLDNVRPIHLLSLMIDSMLWQKNPFGYHLTNVLLHTLNVALLYWLLKRWAEQYLHAHRRSDAAGGAIIAAVLGAAAFAAHPLCTEVVAEPTYREDSLVCLFLLAALLLASIWNARYRGRELLICIGILLCTLLSLGSKEVGAATVGVLFFYWLSMRRTEPARPWLILIGLAGMITVAFLLARFTLQPKVSVVVPIQPTWQGGSRFAAYQTQPRVWTFYLQHLFWPASLCADYTPGSIAHIDLASAVIVVCLLVVLQALGAWRNPLLLLSAALFWLTLLPVSNLLPMYRHIADRFMYAPMLGVACAIAGMVAWVWPNSIGTKGLAAIAVTWIVCLAAIAHRRQLVFSNSFLLWHDTQAKNPESGIAETNLGWAYYGAGDERTALEHFARANDLSEGRLPNVWIGMAMTLEQLNEQPMAEQALQHGVELESKLATPEVLIGSQVTEPQAKLLRRILDRMKK